MHASNLLETAAFVVARKLHNEPTFAWQFNNVLKTRNQTIERIKSQYWKQELKFGILLSKNVEEAFRIVEFNGNHYWRTTIKNELKTVYVVYKLYGQNGENIFPQQIRTDQKKHLVSCKVRKLPNKRTAIYGGLIALAICHP